MTIPDLLPGTVSSSERRLLMWMVIIGLTKLLDKKKINKCNVSLTLNLFSKNTLHNGNDAFRALHSKGQTSLFFSCLVFLFLSFSPGEGAGEVLHVIAVVRQNRTAGSNYICRR